MNEASRVRECVCVKGRKGKARMKLCDTGHLTQAQAQAHTQTQTHTHSHVRACGLRYTKYKPFIIAVSDGMFNM